MSNKPKQNHHKINKNIFICKFENHDTIIISMPQMTHYNITLWLSAKEKELSDMSREEILYEFTEIENARETMDSIFAGDEAPEQEKVEAQIKAWEDLVFAEIDKRNMKMCPCDHAIVFIDNKCAECYWDNQAREKRLTITDYLNAFSIVK
jgi:hypothetical protein